MAAMQGAQIAVLAPQSRHRPPQCRAKTAGFLGFYSIIEVRAE